MSIRKHFPPRWPLLAFLAVLALLCPQRSAGASVVTATITFTNAAVLTNASFGAGATITVNGDTRTWTNTITTPATEIPLTSSNGTNIAQQVQRFLVHAATYPFTGLSPASDGSTYVALRGSAVTVTLDPTNYASVVMSTQTVGTAYTVRMPITVEAPAVRTVIANYLLSALDYGTSGTLVQLGTSNSVVQPIRRSDGLIALEAGSGIALTPSATSVVVSLSGSATVATGNSVWVSKSGDDGTGVRGNIGLAFLTLSAAKAAANSGDTIFVLPGVYSDQDLLKDGVNWHFFNGAVVTNTSVSAAIFQDVDGACVSDITGEGQFTGDGSYLAIVMANSASVVRIKARTILGGNPTIQADDGSLTIDDALIDSGGVNQPILISNTGAVLTLNRCRVVASPVDDNTIAIAFSAGNNNLTLRDCVLIANGTNCVTASGAVNARIYGTLMANVTNNANVTWLTGSTRFEVSTDVQ